MYHVYRFTSRDVRNAHVHVYTIIYRVHIDKITR